MNGKSKHVKMVDIVAISGITAILAITNNIQLGQYLFKFHMVTLTAFYFIGKFARDYEITLWNKRHENNEN